MMCEDIYTVGKLPPDKQQMQRGRWQVILHDKNGVSLYEFCGFGIK